MLTEYERGFTAGLIDGEGCFSLGHVKRKTQDRVIIIGNTNFLLLVKAQKILGGRIRICGGGSHLVTTFWTLSIYMKDWSRWLAEVPLIEKENRRQEFLTWFFKRRQ